MKSRYKDKLVRVRVNGEKLFYTPIEDGHTCGECRKAPYCRDIAKNARLLNGFGTENSRHCMFEQSIFEGNER